MVLLKSHRLKTALDEYRAKAVMGGRGWCPGKIQESGWKEQQMRIDSRWGWGCFTLGWVCNRTNGGPAACYGESRTREAGAGARGKRLIRVPQPGTLVDSAVKDHSPTSCSSPQF